MVDFREDEGMSLLKQEIETFNTQAVLVATPRWLLHPSKRQGKAYSSIVLAVQNEAEADILIKKGILVLGRRLKAEKFLNLKPTDQCMKCQGFSHYTIRCG